MENLKIDPKTAISKTGNLETQNPETLRFGRYEVVAQLGRGAMGIVYKARDPQIDRLVAVKTVSLNGQEPDEEKEFRLRFINEAQAVGRLHHPGIVAIFDVGENPENHDPYIVMEYVAGEPLNRILAREKKLPLATALQLVEEIAEALDYAHSQGVIHRDIKPGNVLITAEGHVKIADFGIAKLNLAHFTIPGRVLGTPAYMAPEQLSGAGVDGRSDLFSLGVILYAMVTGHSPFQGDSATTVCFKVANREPVAASALDLALPRELDEVISRAMAKDPEQRYQRGAEFAEAVRQLQHVFPLGSTTTSMRAGALSATGIGSARTGTARQTASRTNHVAEVVEAEKLVNSVIKKAPLRDVILGMAILVVLVFVGAQTKLLVLPAPKVMNAPVNIPAVPPETSSGSAQPAVASFPPAGTQAAAPAAPAAQIPKPRKVPAAGRAAKQIAKQIVVPLSTLELAVQHQFKDATLFVWVDDKLTLTRPLHGTNQKHLVVFNGLRGAESETLKIPAGQHTIRVRALSADETVDLSRTVSGEFVGGGDKSLQVSIERHNTVMRLSWQ
ncbi:MAG TPA: serine/threonine-protein kinase [Candidatus Sulfotelmatobacter sp.]|jgi:serine/threonine-protein kinase